jgi:hypothetical protein
MYRLEMRIVEDTGVVSEEQRLMGVGVSGLSADDLNSVVHHPRIVGGLTALLHAAQEHRIKHPPVAIPDNTPTVSQAQIARLLGVIQAGKLPLTTATHWSDGKDEFIFLRLSRR